MELPHIIFVTCVLGVISLGGFNTAKSIKTLWVRGGGSALSGWVRGSMAVILGVIGFVTWSGSVAWAYHAYGLPASISLGTLLTGIAILIGVFLLVPPKAWGREQPATPQAHEDAELAEWARLHGLEAWIDEELKRPRA